MSKASKKNKVPKITEAEYAEYIASLKESQTNTPPKTEKEKDC